MAAVSWFFWIGKSDHDLRKFGIWFAIRSSIVHKLEEDLLGINERLMSLRLNLGKDFYVPVFNVFTPRLNNSEDKINELSNILRDSMWCVPYSDKLLILGDFNARASTENDV